MPTTNRKYPNDLGLASPNTPHTHINALANAIDADVAALHADTGWIAWTGWRWICATNCWTFSACN